MKRIRLLLLSGASLVGQNVLAALSGRRAGLHVCAINSMAAEPALRDFDEVFLSGNLRDDRAAYRQRFGEVLAAVAPDLVIPCRDDDVAFLADFAGSEPAWASRMLCGARAPADAMLDKAASWRFALEHGLPFAPTIDATDNPEAIAAFAARHGYPLIAKPREGFASRGVFLVLDRRQVENVAGRPDYVLQRYLGNGQSVLSQVARFAEAGVPLFHSFEAVKLSIQVFIAPDGGQAGLFATRNTMRQGRSERIVRDEDPALIRLGARCAQAFAGAGWRGPLNIQCQRTPDGEIGIYEFNGRYTGATAARCLLGYDEVGIGLEAFCGVPRPALPIAVLTEAVRVPLTRAVDPVQVDQLIRNGHWRDAGVDD